jgi:hypothetical protein
MYRGRYRGRGAGSARAIAVTTAILDRVTTAPYSAYSVRQLYSSYTGSALRVRRASDNTEQDIGFVSGGTLNVTALATFCSGTNGFVTTWYDQTGNNRNLTQATQAAQPQIVSAGTYLKQDNSPALVCAAGQWMTLTAATFTQPFSRSSVFQIDSRVAGHTLLGASSTGTSGRLYEDTTSSLSMDAGTSVQINTANGTGTNGQYTIAELYNNASSTRSLNGVVATINPGTGSITGLNINADYLGSSLAATRFVEVIFWNTALDITSRQTLTLNQRSYFTTP